LDSSFGPIGLNLGLRAEEIAARLGVSRAALYRYERVR
jgi:transcriptional regulator with XRE-family HTH domain